MSILVDNVAAVVCDEDVDEDPAAVHLGDDVLVMSEQ
jgi:hypothetical protein